MTNFSPRKWLKGRIRDALGDIGLGIVAVPFGFVLYAIAQWYQIDIEPVFQGNLNAIHWFVNVPKVGIWISNTLLYFGLSQGMVAFEIWGLAAIILWVSEIAVLLPYHLIRDRKGSRQKQAQGDESTTAQAESAPSHHRTNYERIGTMRAFGYVFSPLAIASSLIVLVAYAIKFAFADFARTVPAGFLPGTVYEVTAAFFPFVIVVWIVFNTLSGRWPIPSLERADIITSGITVLGLVLLAFYLGFSGAYKGLGTDDRNWMIVGLAFAFMDYLYLKGNAFTASSITGDAAKRVAALEVENGALKAQVRDLTAANQTYAGALTQTQTNALTMQKGQLLLPGVVDAMNRTGLTEIGPFNVRFVMTPAGLGIDIPDGEVSAFVAAHKLLPPPSTT